MDGALSPRPVKRAKNEKNAPWLLGLWTLLTILSIGISEEFGGGGLMSLSVKVDKVSIKRSVRRQYMSDWSHQQVKG